MSDVSDLEIGKLIQKVDSLEVMVREQNDRLDQQLERTRGIGIGVVLATVGLSGIGGSLFTRWLSSGG